MVVTDSKKKKNDEKEEKTNKKIKKGIHFITSALLHKKNKEFGVT